MERHIGRAINRTHQRRLQDRSSTGKRASQSSGNSTGISTIISNHCFYYNYKTCKEHPKAIKHMLINSNKSP
jgi:hypothetical protein